MSSKKGGTGDDDPNANADANAKGDFEDRYDEEQRRRRTPLAEHEEEAAHEEEEEAEDDRVAGTAGISGGGSNQGDDNSNSNACSDGNGHAMQNENGSGSGNARHQGDIRYPFAMSDESMAGWFSAGSSTLDLSAAGRTIAPGSGSAGRSLAAASNYGTSSSSAGGTSRQPSRPGAYAVTPMPVASALRRSSNENEYGAHAGTSSMSAGARGGGGGAGGDSDDDGGAGGGGGSVHYAVGMTVPEAPPEEPPTVRAVSSDGDGATTANRSGSQRLHRNSESSFPTSTYAIAEPMSIGSSSLEQGGMIMEDDSTTGSSGSKLSSSPSSSCKQYCVPLILVLAVLGIVVGVTVPLVSSRGAADASGGNSGSSAHADNSIDAGSGRAPTTSPVAGGADATIEEEEEEEARREFGTYVQNILDPFYYHAAQGNEKGQDNEESSNVFGDPTSPQSLALDWVVSQDAYSRQAYTYRSCANVDVDSIVLQRYVLAVTYYSTDGANWDDRLGFLSEDTAACDWNVYDDAEKSLVGVAECDINASENTTTEGLSNICQETDVFYSPITSLVLARNGLLGTIPSELGLLSGLKVLDLSTNTLESIIPSQLAQISSTLEQIVLGDNGLVGSIPAEIFLDSPSLWRLSIWSNGLTGTLPTTLGKCTSLEVISLANNQLTGSLPTEIGHLSRLKDVIIWSNQFTGSIPTELGNCQSLEIYSTPSNLMTGTFPTELGQLTNLTIVFAYENMHTGQIPTELGNLRKLEVFNVAINNLSGTLPTEIGQVSSLRRFRYFDNTGISGTVPSEITSLPLLEDVWVTNTQLGGPFPSVFHPESRIRSIHAEKSAFTGTVPTEIWSLSRFDELQIINTTMTGSPIPDVLPEGNNVAQMSFVTLSGNDFSGTLPSIIGSFQSLTKLLLQNNAFSGDVPSELSNLQSLVELQMQGNDFDSVPPSMCNLRNASGGGMLEIYVSDCDEVGCTCCSECL